MVLYLERECSLRNFTPAVLFLEVLPGIIVENHSKTTKLVEQFSLSSI